LSNSSDTLSATPTRELAAIMFSDVVGYTALMGRDEKKGIQAIAEHRERLRAVLPKFNGRLIGEIGDGTLSSFHSVLDAIGCARELQTGANEDRELRLRIGIHLGDVVLSHDTVLGDGVNIASRIHALAPPGGICISEHVYDEIRNKPEMRATDLGEQKLKNVSRPIRVYTLTLPGDLSEGSNASDTWMPRFWLRRRGIVLTAMFIAAVGVPLGRVYYVDIGSTALVYLPRLLAKPMEQKVGYCKTSDGIRIAYGTIGNGPPVVIVLGWMTDVEHGTMSPTYSSAFLKPIGAHHLVVQYDGRGFGMSDRGVHDYSLEPRVRDIDAIVNALHLKRFALYGISSGGPAAIAYAARHPQRVTRLVLHDAFAYYDLDSLGPADHDRQVAFWSLLRTGWANPTFREMQTSMLMPDAGPMIRAFFTKMAWMCATPEDVTAFLRASEKIDVRAVAKQIRVPTLVIHARGDQLVPIEFAKQLATLIPGARLVIIEGNDHIPIPGDGEAEQIAQHVQPFLDEDVVRKQALL
jgi:class 3 adenylate cyclase/pimeloyl-ACP methyl ester carboxylesterase